MPMEGTDKIVAPAFNFPKGGGAIKGLGESVSSGGMLGTVTLSVPLPISPARAFTPDLSLVYSSAGGNGPFGLGFSLTVPTIARRVTKGVPSYTDQDKFLYFNQERLVPDAQGIKNQSLKEISYRVTRFYPLIESSFDKIEFWQNDSLHDQFWRVYQGDGTQHIVGKTANARVRDPKNPQKILRWLLEESLSVKGEHVLYQYKPEDTVGIDLNNPVEKTREHTAARYLKRVCYANQEGYSSLYSLDETLPAQTEWLLELLFDYGEHTAPSEGIPGYLEENKWTLRQDSFSDYAGGIEVRTHRLCQQVLMFHRFAALGPDPVLVDSLVLAYDENPRLTCLKSAYRCAYGVDQSNQAVQAALPPIVFNYHAFDFQAGSFELFKPLSGLPGLNDGQLYQLVDLYGDGLPGVLYRDGVSTLYRAPKRAIDSTADPDAIAYDAWQPLPSIPSGGLAAQSEVALMDLTGDGQFDWVMTSPGLAGFFSMDSEKNWQHFIPFSAFPIEFNHPRAHLADIMGAGLSDLILMGPNSVRLYANQREQGFSPPIEVEQEGSPQPLLPSTPVNEMEVVAFSDMLGSGQQHLVRIRYNEVVCWPNRGQGKFGKPIKLAELPFNERDFSAKQVFLADIDGSGAVDLLYVESDHIKIFLNQSGNGFAAPYTLRFPPSIWYDDSAQLSFADVKGKGSACLVLTLTHPQPQHWIYDFNLAGKPYLLEAFNNNRGLNTRVSYRSSAQEWLDEKKAFPNAISHLPFPVQLLSKTTQEDEIADKRFQQHFFYRQGYYDGKAREFLGFAQVGHYDSEFFSSAMTKDEKLTFSPVLLTKVWYHTGAPFIDQRDYYAGDTQAIVLADHCWLEEKNKTVSPPYAVTLREFQRALKGNLLREELFSIDQAHKSQDPYRVTYCRYQVRVQQEKGPDRDPVLFPSLLEQISYQYDQVRQDPRCDHQINIKVDRYGSVTESVAINYPRRGVLNAEDPYFDEEQFVLRLQRSFLSVVDLEQASVWRLGLPYESRVETTFFPAPLPEPWRGALSYEKLAGKEGLLASLGVGEIIAWTHYHYWSPEKKQSLPLGEASVEGLMAQVFVADIKEAMLKAVFEEIPDIEDKEAFALELVEKGGYSLHRSGDTSFPAYYWVVSDQPYYGDSQHFFSVESQEDPFGNKTQYEYDPYSYTLIRMTDPMGSQTEALYNYRLLKVWQTKDVNGLVQQMAYDPLGRIVASTFRGYEDNKEAGFALLDSYQPVVMSLEEALRDPKRFIQEVAVAYFYDPFSWMEKTQVPTHTAIFTADNYSGVPNQQIRISIAYSDGFDRDLQTKQLVPAGVAYLMDENGELWVQDGALREEEVSDRWVVSERIDTNNKGLPVRKYQPYFINTYQYVRDHALLRYGFFDRIFYDALGRELKYINAAGFFRRNTYHPWFLCYEDENDTWAEVLEAQAAMVMAKEK